MPFSKEELEFFKKKLIAKKIDILSDLGILEKDLTSLGEAEEHVNPHHLGDIASISEEQLNHSALMEHELKTLQEIDEALQKIEDGTYGICECGNEISYGRLKVKPEAKYCIKCRALKEKYGEL